MATVRYFMLVWALSGTATVRAQEAATAAPTSESRTEQPPAQPTASVPAASSEPAAELQAPVASPSVATAPPVSVFPPPPPPSQNTQFMYEPAPTRVVMLVPRTHAIRTPRAPTYGNAGAPFAIGAGLSFSWPSDVGYSLSGRGRSVSHGELFASYDVWQPVKKLVFAAGAHFRASIAGSNDRADITERAIQADLTARYTATSWLFPHLRIAGGAVGTTMSIDDQADYRIGGDDQRVTYEDKDWAPVGTLGAGFTLRTRARAFETDAGRVSSLSLGVLIEGGYTLASAAQIKLRPTSSPASGLDVKTSQAGSLDRSAPYLRVAGVVRF